MPAFLFVDERGAVLDFFPEGDSFPSGAHVMDGVSVGEGDGGVWSVPGVFWSDEGEGEDAS